jgi:hypothetical protein
VREERHPQEERIEVARHKHERCCAHSGCTGVHSPDRLMTCARRMCPRRVRPRRYDVRAVLLPRSSHLESIREVPHTLPASSVCICIRARDDDYLVAASQEALSEVVLQQEERRVRDSDNHRCSERSVRHQSTAHQEECAAAAYRARSDVERARRHDCASHRWRASAAGVSRVECAASDTHHSLRGASSCLIVLIPPRHRYLM